MDVIAKAAAVTKPTLYAHFGSKDAIFDAVVQDEMEDIKVREWPTFLPDVPLEEQLLNNFMNSLETAFAKDQVSLVSAVLIEFLRRGGPPMGLDGSVPELPLQRWIETAQSHGAFPECDPEKATKMLWAMVKGRLFWPALFGIENPSPEEQRRELEEIIQFFLKRA